MPELAPCLTLAADTVVCVGRRILPKCEIRDEAEACLRLLSGRAHRVYTGLALDRRRRRHAAAGWSRRGSASSVCRARRSSAYLASGEWRGKAGGYAIQGLAGAFVVRLVGSYTNVVGLPLAETTALLAGEGYYPHRQWVAESPQMSADANDNTPPERPAKASEGACLPDLRQTAQASATTRSARSAAPTSTCTAG